MKFDTELILDRLMKSCNISEIKELAKIMGLTQAALSNWKTRGINWNQIFKLCEEKNIDERFVIFGQIPDVNKELIELRARLDESRLTIKELLKK